MENQTINVDAAIKNYRARLRAMKKYNSAHNDEIRARSREYYHNKIKSDPEKYEEYKAMKREQYHNKKIKSQLNEIIKSI